MSRIHCSRKRKTGQHLSIKDREVLEYLYNQNLKESRKNRKTQKELARILGWSEATLSRELKRGAVEQLSSNLETYKGYSAVVAQSRVRENWQRKGPGLKIGKDHVLARKIEEMLEGKETARIGKLRYSPEAIVMHFEQEGWPTATRLCAKTIYNYVTNEVFGRVSQEDLPRRGENGRKRRYRRIGKRLKAPERKPIGQRPESCERRAENGHWEMDCIESVRSDRSCLLTLVDRRSRECLIFKMGRQSQDAVQRRLNGLERKLGSRKFREKFKSITVDNGTEFLASHRLETSVYGEGKRTEIYYANAYSAWERGSNENLNGFIRYFIPKGTELKSISEKELKELEEFINSYPRKILGGTSAKNFSQAAA